MKINYTRGTSNATWEDGAVTGNELMVTLLHETSVTAPVIQLTPVGPRVWPNLVDHIGAWACGVYLDYDMTGDYPVELQVDEGALDGPNGSKPDDIEKALKRRSIIKHLAGTKFDHDQSSHGHGKKKTIKVPDTPSGLKVKEAIEDQLRYREIKKKLEAMVADAPRESDLEFLVADFHTNGEQYMMLYSRAETYGLMDVVDLMDFEGLGIDQSPSEFWRRHAIRRTLEDAQRMQKTPTTIATELEKLTEFTTSPDTQIYVRVYDDGLTYIAQEGRLLTQLGSGTSNGAYNPDLRTKLNHILFGHEPPDPMLGFDDGRETDEWGDPLSHRVPIYGYAAGGGPFQTGSDSWLDNYGTLAMEIDHNFKDSATITLGDSLDRTGVSHAIYLQGLEGGVVDRGSTSWGDPGVEALDRLHRRGFADSDLPIDQFIATETGEAGTYVETQIHQPVDFDPDYITALHYRADNVPPYAVGERAYAMKAFHDEPILYTALEAGIPVKIWSSDGRRLRSTVTDIDVYSDDPEPVLPEGPDYFVDEKSGKKLDLYEESPLKAVSPELDNLIDMIFGAAAP